MLLFVQENFITYCLYYISRAIPHNASSLCLLGRKSVFTNRFCGNKHSRPDFQHISERSESFVFVLSWLDMPVVYQKHNLLSQPIRFTKILLPLTEFRNVLRNRRSENVGAFCKGREYIAVPILL